MWRNYNDVSLSWSSVQGIINWYDQNQDLLIPFTGPGKWNDPDMVNINLLFFVLQTIIDDTCCFINV